MDDKKKTLLGIQRLAEDIERDKRAREELIHQAYSEGVFLREIARYAKMSHESVRRIVQQHGPIPGNRA